MLKKTVFAAVAALTLAAAGLTAIAPAQADHRKHYNSWPAPGYSKWNQHCYWTWRSEPIYRHGQIHWVKHRVRICEHSR